MKNIIYLKASVRYTHGYLQFATHGRPYSSLHRLILSASMAATTYLILITAGRSLSIEKVAVMSGPHMNTRTIERIIAYRAKLQVEGVASISR